MCKLLLVKPVTSLSFEPCENGAKATAWKIITHRCRSAFFAQHTVTELLCWKDYDLEQAGRFTHPLRYDAASDRYLPVSWTMAFAEIGRTPRAIENRISVVSYSSGRCSNETSYLYGLFVRLYGNNNLPDSSNMCHKTTSVALPESIGVPVGMVILDDFDANCCIFFFSQDLGSNGPCMLYALQHASRRGVPIIACNPLRERGLAAGRARIVALYQSAVADRDAARAGDDLAALAGICDALVEADGVAQANGEQTILDHDFIAERTARFTKFIDWLRRQGWDELERRSGLCRSAMEATAVTYAHARSAFRIYGMGLTQHRAGVETVQMSVNLLLLRGNIGQPGAGICPVRGRSNVQGHRTVGITEKPALVPLDRLAEQYGFQPPREPGLNTVEACEAIPAGKIRAFVMPVGNFVRAIPDRDQMEPAWRKMHLTVNVATKLNRSQTLAWRRQLRPACDRPHRGGQTDNRAGGDLDR